MSRDRYKFYETKPPYFLTCTVVGWLPVFIQPAIVQLILDSWHYLQEHGRMKLFGYVVLENHLHFIASSSDPAKEVGDFKSYTARQIIDYLQKHRCESFLQQLEYYCAAHRDDRTYQLWQEGSHPKQILNDEMMWQKLEYMHNNPLRRGYVDDPLHWRYSSARNYARMPSLLEISTQW